MKPIVENILTIALVIFVALLIVYAWKKGVFSILGIVKDKSTFSDKSSFRGTDGPRGYGIATHYGL